ncbi:MAG: hypothetical protein J2P30_04450 [Actinobacteria bacterium]|nr:hypothetical protein [Actinomycetota bacterium]
MRGLRGPAAVFAAGMLAGVAACGSGSATAFQPAGSLSPTPVQAPLSGQAGQRLAGFRFPSDVSIDFTTPAPADQARRAVIDGYQNYVLALWAAVLSHGKDSAYRRLSTGNALGFVRREVARYGAPGTTVKGTIAYSDTRIAGIYFGTGANVLTCVDASAFHQVNTKTGATVGPALPVRLTRYLENVAVGKRSDGTWFVSRLAVYPASSTQGAMCR